MELKNRVENGWIEKWIKPMTLSILIAVILIIIGIIVCYLWIKFVKLFEFVMIFLTTSIIKGLVWLIDRKGYREMNDPQIMAQKKAERYERLYNEYVHEMQKTNHPEIVSKHEFIADQELRKKLNL